MRPSEMADFLADDFPWLNIGWGNTGGGVMCITASEDPTDAGDENGIAIGTANSNIGWASYDGERHGDITKTTAWEEAWWGNQDFFGGFGTEIYARIKDIIAAELPGLDPAEEAATAVAAQLEDLDPKDRIMVLRMALRAEEGR